MNHRELVLLCELVAAEFDNDLTLEQFTTLNNMLKHKEYALKYVELVSMFTELAGQSRLDQILANNADQGIGGQINTEILSRIVDIEDSAPAIELESEVEEQSQIVEHKDSKESKSSRFFKLFDRFIYLAAVFMVLFIAYAELFSPQYSIPVATVTDQVDVRWSKSSEQFHTSDRLLTNQFPYKIDKGIVSIKYDQGVDVVIEGPAEFTIEKNGIDLAQGRIYSYVSEVGRGFTVDTINNRYVDLGTEFGVSVEKETSEELHVLKGKVQFFSGLTGAPKDSSVIFANDARRFNSKTGKVSAIPVETELFARQLDSKAGMIWRGQKTLDLTRLAAGRKDSWNIGDAVGINPVDGKYVDANYNRRVNSNNKYSIVADSKIVDGVFIPDGGDGEVVISSTGLTFACPDTSGGYTQNICLFRSGIKRENSKVSDVIFNGVEIEKNPESIMCFHSNCGMTIDLKAIKESMPGHELSGFKALGGITEFVDGLIGRPADIDLWVLVDGQLKYSRELLMVKDGTIDIDIDLADDARFLTIIVTDGLRPADPPKYAGWENDFFYLVNPEIVLDAEINN